MIYGREFFDLQLMFARAVAARSGLALARAILDYTNCYIRFGLGRDFDPEHPRWQEYVAGLRETDDHGDWTHRFYLTCPATTPPGLVATVGCFGYARLSAQRLRLHFLNAETAGRSPLATERQSERLAELAALFERVKRAEPNDSRMVGASWLYNVAGYRRLFPASYLATARVAYGRFRHLPLWGQFVDRNGEIRKAPAAEFRERLARETDPAQLERCFPLPVLQLEAPVSAFFDQYGVSRGSACLPRRACRTIPPLADP